MRCCRILENWLYLFRAPESRQNPPLETDDTRKPDGMLDKTEGWIEARKDRKNLLKV